VICAAVFLAVPIVASGWVDDFFDGRASGQAVYEEMSVHPQAVRVEKTKTTYVVYQGLAMDPYIVAFTDGSTKVVGPYRIGKNTLVGGVNHDDPSDSHGAPSIVYSLRTDRLSVFWGAHRTQLQYARNMGGGDIKNWEPQRTIATPVTYPQPMVDATGTIHVFFRYDKQIDVADAPALPTGSWAEITSADDGSTWSAPSVVLRSSYNYRWYAHFQQGSSGTTVHAAVVGDQIASADPYYREGVYYMARGADGVWRDADGASLVTTELPTAVEESALTSATLASAVCTDLVEFQNQATLAENPKGGVGLLYVSGKGNGPDKYRWVYAHRAGSEWVKTTVATTDHFMDSSTLEYRADGSIEAFLTMEGTLGTGTNGDRYVDRGGDIVRWTSADESSTWVRRGTIKTSNLSAGVVYNDPQFVDNHDGGPRLLFGEWDNDAGNYIHKVYLWGDAGLIGKEFFPSPARLGGSNRYDTAATISGTGFPTGSNYVIVASGEVYADALAGVPLAEAYKAPLLLVSKNSVSATVTAEIKRLAAEKVIVLGGPNTITDATLKSLRVGSVISVRRISGANRYAVAQNIATELRSKRGKPTVTFVASGENFPDALSVSALAAVRGAPILLTKAGTLPLETLTAVRDSGAAQTIVVGGTSSVSDAVAAQLPAPTRVPGANRYDAAAGVAYMGLDGGPGVPAKTLRTDRLVIASGEVFPDALAGGVLAARMRCPVLLTPGSRLSPTTRGWIDQRARRVLDYYFLGGERTLTPGVAASVTDALRGHQAE
jgi:putative cell wall-binding protein